MSKPTNLCDASEKQRRVYYQDIVYKCCNALDGLGGGSLVCGTIEDPQTEVQDAVQSVCQENATLKKQHHAAIKALFQVRSLTMLTMQRDELERVADVACNAVRSYNEEEFNLLQSATTESESRPPGVGRKKMNDG